MIGRAFATLVNREWMVAWKHRSGYMHRSVYAVLLLLLGAGFTLILTLGHGIRSSDFAEVSQMFFTVLSLGQLLLLTLLGTTVFTRSLYREKERDTLDLLVVSPVWRFEILFGKAIGDFVSICAVLAAGAPVFCLLLVLGGVTFSEIVSVHLILLGQLAFVAGICILFMVFFSNYFAVMTLTWVVVFGFLFAGAIGGMMLPAGAGLWSLLERISPFTLLARELTTVSTRFGPSLAVLGSGFSVLILFCALGSRFLDWGNEKRKERGDRGSLWSRLRRALERLASGRFLRWIVPSFRLGRHPLVRRECSLDRDPGFRIAWLVYVVLYVALLMLVVLREREEVELHIALGAFGILFAMLIAVVHAALSVHSAKRQGIYEVLLSANVEPEPIVKAKIWGLVLRTGYLLVPPMTHAVIAGLILSSPFMSSIIDILVFLAGLVIGAFTAILMSVALSLEARSPVGALIRSILIAIPCATVAGLIVGAGVISFLLTAPLMVPYLLGVYARTLRRFRRQALA